MIVFVITFNLIITLINCYLALKMWRLRILLALITSAILNCENYLHTVFLVAPQFLNQKRANIYQFRHSYQLWLLQLQQAKQIIVILNWSYRLWKKYKVAI